MFLNCSADFERAMIIVVVEKLVNYKDYEVGEKKYLDMLNFRIRNISASQI